MSHLPPPPPPPIPTPTIIDPCVAITRRQREKDLLPNALTYLLQFFQPKSVEEVMATCEAYVLANDLDSAICVLRQLERELEMQPRTSATSSSSSKSKPQPDASGALKKTHPASSSLAGATDENRVSNASTDPPRAPSACFPAMSPKSSLADSSHCAVPSPPAVPSASDKRASWESRIVSKGWTATCSASSSFSFSSSSSASSSTSSTSTASTSSSCSFSESSTLDGDRASKLGLSDSAFELLQVVRGNISALQRLHRENLELESAPVNCRPDAPVTPAAAASKGFAAQETDKPTTAPTATTTTTTNSATATAETGKHAASLAVAAVPPAPAAAAPPPPVPPRPLLALGPTTANVVSATDAAAADSAERGVRHVSLLPDVLSPLRIVGDAPVPLAVFPLPPPPPPHAAVVPPHHPTVSAFALADAKAAVVAAADAPSSLPLASMHHTAGAGAGAGTGTLTGTGIGSTTARPSSRTSVRGPVGTGPGAGATQQQPVLLAGLSLRAGLHAPAMPRETPAEPASGGHLAAASRLSSLFQTSNAMSQHLAEDESAPGEANSGSSAPSASTSSSTSATASSGFLPTYSLRKPLRRDSAVATGGTGAAAPAANWHTTAPAPAPATHVFPPVGSSTADSLRLHSADAPGRPGSATVTLRGRSSGPVSSGTGPAGSSSASASASAGFSVAGLAQYSGPAEDSENSVLPRAALNNGALLPLAVAPGTVPPGYHKSTAGGNAGPGPGNLHGTDAALHQATAGSASNKPWHQHQHQHQQPLLSHLHPRLNNSLEDAAVLGAGSGSSSGPGGSSRHVKRTSLLGAGSATLAGGADSAFHLPSVAPLAGEAGTGLHGLSGSQTHAHKPRRSLLQTSDSACENNTDLALVAGNATSATSSSSAPAAGSSTLLPQRHASSSHYSSKY